MGGLIALFTLFPMSEKAYSEGENRDNEKVEDGLNRKMGIASVLLEHVKKRASGDHKAELGQELGVGLILGVSSGFAVKKAARTLLFTVRCRI